jgi:hypothetical protein
MLNLLVSAFNCLLQSGANYSDPRLYLQVKSRGSLLFAGKISESLLYRTILRN